MSEILLVADDVWVQNDVAASLIDPDVHLVTVDDSAEAAARVVERPFDAVVVDLQVKNMGGMAITRELKAAMFNGDIRPAPIVMLLDRQADVFLARRAGAEGWLVKPFTPRQLRSLLADLTAPAAS